jgi:methylmalonyl-CoA mutase
MDDLTGEAAAMARRLDRPDIELLVADGRLWHAAGASEAQELAAVLASFVAHLRSLSAHGISLDRAVALVGLVLTADADQFLTIAKFRAMRLLHARIVEAAGLPPGRCRIHAETAWRMMSRRDRRANILRTTGAAFSAAVGGADSITVLPFDVLDDDPRPHARRLARNTQLVLAREAHVGATADPGAGSGAIEQLTDALAAAAWSKFQAIEAAGGMAASVRAGTLQREIAATRSGRLARVARGDIQLVGANVFPGTVEGPGPAPVRQSPRPDHPAESVEPLVFTRLSESSETGDPAATGRRSAS